MDSNEAYLAERLRQMPAIDAHTHIDGRHPSARGLHDILLYHMVISELYSAGCPDGDRLPEEPSEELVLYRLERAVPYVKYIQNTSCFWLVKVILRDLYGWEQDITEQNWRQLHALIQSKSGEEFARETAKKAGLIKVNTELWRGVPQMSDLLFYSLEWSFFTRAQWGVFDTALLELEHGWNHDEPCPPLPVTASKEDLKFKKKIKTLDDVHEALEHYVTRIPYDKIVTIASHFSTLIHYRPVSVEEMEKALKNRDHAGEWEREVYANYIFNRYLQRHLELCPDMPLQFSLATEPLPYETISMLHTDTPFELASIVAAFPKLRFHFHLANAAVNQTFCTMVRELPNLTLNGYWWHNFFPAYIERVLDERLDMLPINKQIGFFSDAYCMDWAYAKSMLVRDVTAKALAKRVDRGQFDRDTAVELGGALLAGTASQFFSMTI